MVAVCATIEEAQKVIFLHRNPYLQFIDNTIFLIFQSIV